MAGVYKLAPHERFPSLPAAPPVPEPALPPELIRGRLSSSFLRGQWQGEFAAFGLVDRAKILLDLRTERPTVRMTHANQEWAGEDDVTAKITGPDAEGVVNLTYSSKGKNCTVEVKLVRVGDQLRGLVRFITEGSQEWVRSSVALTRN
jgi:hypothetical protein